MLGIAALALLTACGQAGDKANTPAKAAAPVANADGKYVTAEGLERSTPDTWGEWGVNLANVKAGVC